MMKSINLLFIIITIVLIGCSTKKIVTKSVAPMVEPMVSIIEKNELKDVPVPSETPTRTSAMANKMLAGKQLYTANCAKCHQLYNPKDYTPAQWVPILNRMEIKAGITNAQRRMIEDYLGNG